MRARSLRQPRSCAECGQTFTADPRARYCSQLCRGRAKEGRIAADPDCAARRAEQKARANKKHYYRDVEAARAGGRASYARNAEQRRADALAAYYRNPAATMERNARWRESNRDRYRMHVRLTNHRRRAFSTRPFTIEQLDARAAYFGYRCWVCGIEFTEWDHVKPVSKGGPHMLANLRPICTHHNRRKSARWPGAAGLDELVQQLTTS